MATSGITCVVRQSFNKFVRPHRTNLLVSKVQKCSQLNPLLLCPCASYSTSVLNSNDVVVQYRHGLSVFTVPLPSRKESCEFVLKPVSHTVKDLVNFLKEEDKGIDRVAVFKDNGSKVAGSTTIDILLRSDFQVVINENTYTITPPQAARLVTVPTEDIEKFEEVKTITQKLFSQLNVEEHQLRKEQEIIQHLEDYKLQIAPLEEKKLEFEQRITSKNRNLTYVGSALMGFQFGFFARLTWWEYSWDVMEPVTYFATYIAIMAMYGYFVVTSQEYNYVETWDREFLRKFHQLAEKEGFDILEYNRLMTLISQCESDLRRLRDPLQVHLPIREL